MPVNWTPENNHKILIYLLKRMETKDIGVENLALLIEGATPKAIREQIAKLRREAKSFEDDALATEFTAINTTANDEMSASPGSKVGKTGKPRGRGRKYAVFATAEGMGVGGGEEAGGGKGKRKRAVTEEEDGGMKKVKVEVEEEDWGMKKVKVEVDGGDHEETGLENGIEGEKGEGVGGEV